MKFPKNSYSAVAFDYAKQVVAGKIPACWQVRAACQRSIDDLKRKNIRWSTERADHVCQFLEALCHTKGRWAGQNIKLEPFQIWMICNIFAWEDVATGYRRIRSAFILLPRKQGKSIIAAGIALYMTFADGEVGAEGYCGASNLAQANEVFTPAKRMAELSPGFRDAFDIEVMAKSIFSEMNGQSFTPVIGKTKDGSSPHVAICDELHQAKDETQIQAFRTGMGARTEPLLLVITTAGVNLAGVCRLEQLDAEAVLSGVATDDRLFAAIYTIDADDDWRDIKSWIKANPNFGVSVDARFFEDALAKALQSPANAAFARTKYLNQWLSSASSWLNASDWSKAADKTLDLEKLTGRKAWLGCDFSTRNDLTAIALVIALDDGKKAIFPFSFAPFGAIDGSVNSTAYAGWAESEDLIVSEGTASSFKEVEAKIEWIRTTFDVQLALFDVYQGENTRQKFEALGMKTASWQANDRGQWTVTMDDFEAELKNGTLVHPDNAVLNWCAANVCALQRGRTRVPVKPRDEAKIDTIVSALMAFGGSNEPEAKPTALPIMVF